MTKEQALIELQIINNKKFRGDAEVGHLMADGVLCDLLMALGYADVVAAWEEIDKWYA